MTEKERKDIIESLKKSFSGDTKGHALRYAEHAFGDIHIRFLDVIHEMWTGETLEDQDDDTLIVFESIKA